MANKDVDIVAQTVNEADVHAGPVPLKRYMVTLPAGQNTFTLTFSGRIHHAVQDPSLEYARSFSYSPGLISAEGVFLANSTAWYPQFDEGMVSFNLDVRLPADWDVVSQGSLIQEHITETTRRVTWEEKKPQDDIYLVAGRISVISNPPGRWQLMFICAVRIKRWRRNIWMQPDNTSLCTAS